MLMSRMSGASCARNIDLAVRKSWCESNDPEFVAKAANVAGLYVNPPVSVRRREAFDPAI